MRTDIFILTVSSLRIQLLVQISGVNHKWTGEPNKKNTRFFSYILFSFTLLLDKGVGKDGAACGAFVIYPK